MHNKKGYKSLRTWVAIASSIVFTVALSVAIRLGIQSRNDRVLTAKITQSESDLKLIGAKIADIENRDLKTMADYINAYAQIEPLQNDYDQKLQQYSDLCSMARQRDQNRGLMNVQRLYLKHNPEICRGTSEIIDLVRQVNEITKKETSVIRDMASLPEREQVQFWHEEFLPLAAEEHALREKLLLAGQRMSPERTTQ